MRLGLWFCHRLLIATACLWLGLGAACAADRVLDVRTEPADHSAIGLTRYFDILEDPSKTWSLADVQTGAPSRQFRADQPDGTSVGFGYSASAFWLRLRLANPGAQPLNRFLEIANPSLAFVEFHVPHTDGTYRSLRMGSQLPFQDRPYPHRNFVLPITLPPHSEQVVYIRVQSVSPMAILGKLWTPEDFHQFERSDYIGQAWYFGIASAMIVFNFLLFLALRDLIYLRYVVFVSSMAFTLASQHGLVKEYLIQDAPWWSIIGVMIGFAITLASALAFMRHMLNTRRIAPRLDWLARVFTAAMLLAPFLLAWNQAPLMAPITSLFGITAVVILGIGVVCAVKRERSAYFFVGAFSLLCMAGVLTTVRSLGILAPSFWTENALRIGSAFEMLLLAFALADRFNVIRQEKVNAQRAALAAQQHLVETLQTSERMLEQRVAERTAELDQKNQDLNRAIASREDVERIARHDIKTPLGSLAAAPALLRAGCDPTPHEEIILTMMEKAAYRALNMVDLSLDLYQMEAGTYVFHPHTVHLADMLQSVVQDLGVHARSKAVKLEVKGLKAASYVQGNDSLCYSIIANLTKNAIEAAPEHSVVTITLSAGPWVQVCIHNLGEVPADLKDTFFTKYSSSGKMGGTGLGTYSAHLLARVQGGWLTMESSQAQGTTLTLALKPATPVTIPSDLHTQEERTETSINPVPAINLPPLQVLVVDDDEFNLMVVDSYLPQPPLQVKSALNGRLALQAVMEDHPDVIILDVEMPIMGGMEALGRIRAYQADQAQVPSYIVAYSGSDDAQSIEKYLAAGFDKCLKKPSSRQAVLALLRQSINAGR